MSKNFLLASSNNHKAQELSELLAPLLINPSSEKLEVVEDGISFSENSFKKAKAYYDRFKAPVLADDSGLCVEALPDELGIYSARFGGQGLSDKARAEFLLTKLENISNRKAYFICDLCFYLDPNEVFHFEGRVYGEIAQNYRGDHGFGYDPVFIPLKHEGPETLGEIPEWKSKNSHRSIACFEALKFFNP